MAAEFVYLFPDKFPILRNFKFSQVEGIFKRNSDVEFLREGQVADIEFGGLLLQGEIVNKDEMD